MPAANDAGVSGPGTVLALDLGTATGWALRDGDGAVTSGTVLFRPERFESGGMRYLRFKHWLTELKNTAGGIDAVYIEEVRRHAGTNAAHIYGGFLAHVTAWCEHHGIPYRGVPVGTIKRHITGKGNAPKQAVIAAVRGRGSSCSRSGSLSARPGASRTSKPASRVMAQNISTAVMARRHEPPDSLDYERGRISQAHHRRFPDVEPCPSDAAQPAERLALLPYF